MLVDDQFVSRLLVTEILKSDYELVCYQDARKALGSFIKEKPDLLITDLMMPVMSGFELIEAIKRQFPHMPVLAVSAYSEYKNDGWTVMFEDFLAKPYSAGSLKRKVTRILKQNTDITH